MTKKNSNMRRKSGLLNSQRSMQRGAISLLTAICLPLIFGILALSVDVSYALSMKTNMQAAADNAARAAAEVRGIESATESMVKLEALNVAAANGYRDGDNATVKVYLYPNITKGNYTGAKNAVEVIISSDATAFFGPVMNLVAGQVGARAVSDWDAAPCLVALNPANSGSTGIAIGGNTYLDAKCGVVSNSTSMTASVSVGGSSGLLDAASLRMGGDTTDPLVKYSNKSQGQTPNPFEKLIQSLPTQYASVTNRRTGVTTCGLDCLTPKPAVQTVSGQCTQTPSVNSSGVFTSPGYDKTTKTLVLGPGYYDSGIQVKATMCDSGGKKYDISDVKMLPGDFYLNDVSPGGFSQDGLTLVAREVAIVLMNTADFSMNAGSITLAPYSNGQYPYITLIGNTNTTGFSGFTSNTIALVDITGSFVMPRKNFKVAGNVAFKESSCLLIVAWYLQLNSSGSIGGGCRTNKMNLAMIRGPLLRE